MGGTVKTKHEPIDPDSKFCHREWGHHGEHACSEHIVCIDDENADNSYVVHCCECGVELDTDMEGRE